MKMLIKIEILSASHNLFYWSIGFMIKRPNLIYIFYNSQMRLKCVGVLWAVTVTAPVPAGAVARRRWPRWLVARVVT